MTQISENNQCWRILSWNVNSVRNLRQYYPWNECTTFGHVLHQLGDADIICFQEEKVSKLNLKREVAMPEWQNDKSQHIQWDSYHSFNERVSRGPKSGYSGVGTYVRHGCEWMPVACEEGISGLLHKPNSREHLGHHSPIGHYGHLFDEFTLEELRLLDSEGRCIITDHQAFVLLNIYFPNEGSDPTTTEVNDKLSISRSDFRMMYYKAFELRLRALVMAKRECIVVGDFNVTHEEIDHCDPEKNKKELNITHYQNTRGREWFHNLLIQKDKIPSNIVTSNATAKQTDQRDDEDATANLTEKKDLGQVIDTLRYFRPFEKGLFTHWSNILNARPVNYGTRIDYIVTTPNLISTFQDSNVLQHIMGSDHCPVMASVLKWNYASPALRQIWIDAAKHCPLTSDSVCKLDHLKDSQQLLNLVPQQPPTLCAKNYSQFQGNQTSLKAFFNQPKDLSPISKQPMNEEKSANDYLSKSDPTKEPATTCKVDQNEDESNRLSANDSGLNIVYENKNEVSLKRPATFADADVNNQSFTSKKVNSKAKKQASNRQQNTLQQYFQGKDAPLCSQDRADLELNSSPTKSANMSEWMMYEGVAIDSNNNAKKTWEQLFSMPPTPNCKIHQEPAKLYTVNKKGLNHGKKFYLCQRPVGPGQDGRCDFFQWMK